MKICFITDHKFSTDGTAYYSGGGLPARMLLRYVRQGSELLVVGRRSRAGNTTLASAPQISFHLLKAYNAPQDAFLHGAALRRELDSCISRADGVILRIPSVLALVAIGVCRRRGKPYLLEICGSAYDSFRWHGDLTGRLAAPVLERYTRRAVAASRWTLYVTQSYLQNNYPSHPQARTLACSDVALAVPPASVLDERLAHISRADFSLRPVRCGQIGNASVPYKGYRIMLLAMRNLRRLGIHVEYHIVGGGDSSALSAQARTLGVGDSLVMHGKMDHECIGDFMQEMDIYVHPSFQEGLPRSIVEAISYGVPCVASNVGGIGELVQEGYMHSVGDSDKLATDLLRLIQDKQELKEVATRNFNHAKVYYPEVLDARRSKFYDAFFQTCNTPTIRK